ncbi:transposase [Virgisporangium ochraceum]|uniref:transposase n=1 Tax=Virgisporangium ochraceum TaxID=65505 RepID=UPI001940B4F4
MHAVSYLVDHGIKWREPPTDSPPWQTVYGLFARWCAETRSETGSTAGPATFTLSRGTGA